MILKAYSVRDAKSEIFGPPFYKHMHGEAERDFQTLVNDEKSTVFNFPEDYDLYYLGDYDNNKGLFKSLDTPQHMVKAVQLRKKKVDLN